ncbi:MAG: AtpZ/AtpI family protein [Alphaproteobacteria bacterium]
MSEEKEILEKLDALNKRAEKIRKRSKVDDGTNYESSYEEITDEDRKGAQAGSEFLASVFGGGILGYGIDWFFQTTPWAMIVFIILGFVSGVYRANAAIQGSNKK